MATAFENVSVVTMEADRVLEEQTVLTEGDRIAWIGAESEARIPADARRVDGGGCFLMPGLADMHTHPITEEDLLLFVAHGVTTIRNMWGMPRHLAWREQATTGDLLGPAIHTTGPIIDGLPVTRPWLTPVTSAEEAGRVVDATAHAGYEAIKVYNQLSPDAYRWLVDAARARGVPVVGHVPFQVGLHRVLEAGQRSIEHLYGYIEAMLSEPEQGIDPARGRTALFEAAQAAQEDRLSELAAATGQAGTWNCPTLIVRRRYIQDLAALQQRPELSYATPTRLASWREHLRTYPTDELPHRLCELHLRLIKALSDAGAGLLVGTDSPVPMVTPGASVHEELESFVMAGLTPYQALRAATADAARFAGESSEWGTVTVGGRADLLLVDANPLLDVANASRIAGVMVRGRWLPREELTSRLDDLAARQAADSPESLTVGTSRSGPRTKRRRFRMEWGDRIVGEDELTVEPTNDGGHLLRTRTSVEQFGYFLLPGFEAGSYQAVVRVGRDGTDQTAAFQIDGLDGQRRIEMVRKNGSVRVRCEDPGGDTDSELLPDTSGAWLTWPLTTMYGRLGRRVQGLAVGDSTTVDVLGPGLPPNIAIGAGTVRVQRLPDPIGGDAVARYRVEFSRPNATYAGVLTCDAHGRLLELELDGPDRGTAQTPPIRVIQAPDDVEGSSSGRPKPAQSPEADDGAGAIEPRV